MKMIDISCLMNTVILARNELQKEVISENMMGIDFSSLLWQCRPTVLIMRLTEDYDGYEMEYRKV